MLRNVFKNLKKNQIIIGGIHYFNTKLKTKIDVIIPSRFNIIAITLHCYMEQSELAVSI